VRPVLNLSPICAGKSLTPISAFGSCTFILWISNVGLRWSWMNWTWILLEISLTHCPGRWSARIQSFFFFRSYEFQDRILLLISPTFCKFLFSRCWANDVANRSVRYSGQIERNHTYRERRHGMNSRMDDGETRGHRPTEN
jgi:hypothetical protein